jgi:methyltransferase (TIGR00027 family)
MARTDDDTWDLASSVGVTATLVAAARALASREDDPLIVDPFAEALVRAVGIETLTRALDGGAPLADQDAARLLIDVIAVRTKFFDDFFHEATQESGIRQAVILASGLDSRAYRLPWPINTTVFEIDQAPVIDFKSRVLSDLGASPAADRRTVGVDLREDWPAALRDHGFDDTSPTAWIAEGLLIYLPPDAQDRLFDNITALSAPGSRIATEYHPDGGTGIAERAASMSSQWRDQGLDLDLGNLFYGGERRPVIDYLEDLGWQVSARPRPEMFVAYGRQYPDDAANAALRKSLSVTAIRK